MDIVSILGMPLEPIIRIIAAVIGSASLIAAAKYTSGPAAFETWDGYIEKWKLAKGDIPKLIESESLQEPPPDWTEGDIYDYGVERILIVERDLLVDWLVLNSFHADQRALILAASGYPKYLMAIAQRLLHENANLPVFLLHDSTMVGQMMQQHSSFRELLEGHPVVDLGLYPDDVKGLRRLRYLKPKRRNFEIPVDFLPYGLLAPGLAAAMDEGIPLGELLNRSKASYDDGGDMGGWG